MTPPGFPAPQGRERALPPGVVIANGFSTRTSNGTTVGGDLVATAIGLQVQARRRTGFRKTAFERFTLLPWEYVERYELTGTEVVTQTLKSHKSAPFRLHTQASSVLVLHTATDQLVVRSPLAPSQMRQLLSRNLAAIDHRVQPVGALSALGPVSTSVADELTKLASLHASGALTDGEFAAQKARLRTGWGDAAGRASENDVRCRWCYRQNPSSARNCDYCGAPLDGRNVPASSGQVNPAVRNSEPVVGSAHATQPLSFNPAPPQPYWPGTDTSPRPRKRRHRIRKLLLGIVALLVLLAILGAILGGPSYSVAIVSFRALNSSAVTIGFNVTNTGTSAGSPACTVTVTSPGDVKSTKSVVLSRVAPHSTDMARNIIVTVPGQAAHQITFGDVAVSC